MKRTKRSDVPWLAAALLLVWIGRGKRKRRSPGGHLPPGGHHVPRVLSLPQLRELAAAAGMADANTGAAIAMAESSGDTRAVGDHGDSIGLWQIHVPSCPKQWANRDMLKHAGFNAQAAASMSNGGTDWHLWSSFKNGAYKKHMPTP